MSFLYQPKSPLVNRLLTSSPTSTPCTQLEVNARRRWTNDTTRLRRKTSKAGRRMEGRYRLRMTERDRRGDEGKTAKVFVVGSSLWIEGSVRDEEGRVGRGEMNRWIEETCSANLPGRR